MLRSNFKVKFLIVIVILILSVFIGSAFYTEPPKAELSFFAMNTYVDFTAYGENAQSALERAEERVKELESLWSVTDERSDIYRANHSNGESVEVSKETANLISFTLDMSKRTDGALDPTVYPVLTAWGFTTDTKQVPAQESISELLSLVDYSKVSIADTLLRVPPGMELDLGGVGKGYTADIIAELLRKQGVESAMLNLGGNIQAIGARPDGSSWRIAIQDPRGNGNLGVMEISNAAVVTSGRSENYFEDAEGNTYWHILDPATGYPADSGLQAVTIVSAEGRLSDALSTAMFVMGAEKAEQYWKQNGGFEMLLITNRNEILITDGLANQFSLDEGRPETVRILQR